MRKMKKKNINLYEQYQRSIDKANKKKMSTKTLWIICGSAGLAVLAGIYVVFSLQLKSVQEQYDDLYGKIYSDAAAEQSVNAERLEYENQILQLIADRHTVNVEKIEEENKITRNLYAGMIKEILDCQVDETRINTISFDKGIVFISGEARESLQASGFVSALDEKGIFEEVRYTGYELKGNVYIFSATGYFSGDQIKDDNAGLSLDKILEEAEGEEAEEE